MNDPHEGATEPARTVAVVLGTRPEAIKLAPVVRAIEEHGGLRAVVISTGQHREMLDQMLARLEISPHEDLGVMRPRQTLADLTSRLVGSLGEVLRRHGPAAVVVQGDTTTAFTGALAAFYERIPVAHVEAGLRSGSLDNPFPEEVNRRLVGQMATWHFAPTSGAADNLAREAVPRHQIDVTGNTAIDNLLWARTAGHGQSAFRTRKRRLLVTLHRRENQGESMRGLATAVKRLAERGDVEVVLPMHLSPAVREVIQPVLSGTPDVRLVEPLDYFDFTASLADSDLVLSDSGGVQEEAPTLGKPVLVLRDNTERPEAVQAGVARLVGVAEDVVFKHATELLDEPGTYAAMARAVNPFGDGCAAGRIADRLHRDLAAAW